MFSPFVYKRLIRRCSRPYVGGQLKHIQPLCKRPIRRCGVLLWQVCPKVSWPGRQAHFSIPKLTMACWPCLPPTPKNGTVPDDQSDFFRTNLAVQSEPISTIQSELPFLSNGIHRIIWIYASCHLTGLSYIFSNMYWHSQAGCARVAWRTTEKLWVEIQLG
jgi:hypothetical protein